MTNNTHTQLPEKLIVIDKEWLEEMKSKCDKLAKEQPHYEIMYNGINDFIIQMESNNSSPLTPILEEALENGAKTMFDISYILGGIVPQVRCNPMSLEQDKKYFLSQPITLKKK
jgi:hypothetical protein